MKRTISILSLIFIFATFIAGCGNDQYAIEKRYWQAQKQAEKIFNNPGASPPKELENVVGLLNQFSSKYSRNRLAIDADFTIARLYIVKKEYDNARLQLKKIIKNYNKFHDICAEAVFLMGNSYEIDDKWASALEQYKKIMQEYPLTPRGLSVPVYIAVHYKTKYQPDKMIAAYQEAVAHYKSLADKYPNSPLAYTTSLLAADCYGAIKDWQNVVAIYNEIVQNYKGKVNLESIFMTMALIYNNELKDEAKAKEMLEQLVKEYPKSKLTNRANTLLKEIKK